MYKHKTCTLTIRETETFVCYKSCILDKVRASANPIIQASER